MTEFEMNLILGDCFEEIRKIGNNSFDVIITDPLYNFDKDTIHFLHKQFLRLAKCVIVFAPPENQWVLPADQHGFWVKSVSTKNTSKNYSRFVEMIFVYGRNEWNSDRHWSQYTNIFTDLVDGKLHPHQKPESLIRRLVLNHTNTGNKVFDPFMGSGTTGLVCRKLARSFVGIEIDKHYFEIASRRISANI